MTAELEKNYDPKQVQDKLYKQWLDAKAFHARPEPGSRAFAIVIPPPNVTAALHLGHALNNTLQDILTRWKRMEGCNTLWMPGTDHAGIATQTVVDKRLKAEGKPDLAAYRKLEEAGQDGRSQFVAKVQAWKDEYERTILGQLKAMGCSCDWDRTRFTMDETCARAVREAFFKLFSDGLIYRGKRLVNWDPATQTVLADDEVEHETVNGSFWYLKYPLEQPVTIEGNVLETVTVATTRPETMLGDTAVAMNPADPRAKYLVGKNVRLPLVGRLIPIIADEHVVLPDPNSDNEKAKFGTGFLKVTPAHDPDDYAIRERHNASQPDANIDIINVLAPDGTISDKHGWADAAGSDAEQFLGMDRFEAREAIVEWFRTEGLLEDIRPYAHEVGHSYRSHVPIEPYLSDQWYIAVKKPIRGNGQQATGSSEEMIPGTDVPVNSLAGLGLAPLLDGRLKFVPDRYANNYRTWLENLRDWPISRQLWWGHRIPVWKGLMSNLLGMPGLTHDAKDWQDSRDTSLIATLNGIPIHVSTRSEDGVLYAYACISRPDESGSSESGDSVAIELEKIGFVRDSDVLDTWFSSGLWPISTMGWPEETDLLKTFYPTSVLCTAREIITLWVSRMVMFGQYFRGDIPFRDVYIHAMIQDGQGRKMSKSLGNGIDPLDIIESHGADAMRFTLAYMTTETQDVRMPVEKMTLPDGRKANSSPKFDLGRNFCNKLWNASRFAMMNLRGTPSWGEVHPAGSLADAWILSRMNRTIRDATVALQGYQFHDMADALYRYMWNDFCDWYLEIAKVRMNAGEQAPKAILAHGLDVLLRLLHPVIPFITEAIWQHLNTVAGHRGPGDKAAEPMLVKAAWPMADPSAIDDAVEGRFAMLQTVISGIREVRNGHNVPTTQKLSVAIAAEGDAARVISDNAALIKSLAGVEDLAIDPAAKAGKKDASVVSGAVSAFIRDVVDPEAELVRLQKRQAELARGISAAEGKLDNPKFVERAKPDVVESERHRLAGMKAELESVERSLKALG